MVTIPQLTESIKTIGRSLPLAMEIWFGRDEGDARVKMEIVEPDGKTTTYAFLECRPLPLFPPGALQREMQLENALRDLLATIELHTDCMTGEIDRAALDDYIDAAEKLLLDGCGACGDACDGKGSCRVASDSPLLDDQEWLS